MIDRIELPTRVMHYSQAQSERDIEDIASLANWFLQRGMTNNANLVRRIHAHWRPHHVARADIEANEKDGQSQGADGNSAA
ncbi:MAG: hypothetical protein AAF532_02240 [Planctomycetota bacterium]